MIAQLLFAAKSQFFDNNGDVMTLGSVDITYSLTAEPAPTYKDSAKTILNDTPIQLTAAGKADIYLDAGSYNIVTRNREGVVVDTTNNYVVSDHAQINIGGDTPIGGIIMYAGLIVNIPVGWHLCDGSGGTPPLQDRFIKGTVYQDDIGDEGGSSDAIVTAHTHWIDHTHEYPHTHEVGSHTHPMPHTHSMDHNHPSVSSGIVPEYESLVESEGGSSSDHKDGFTTANGDADTVSLVELEITGEAFKAPFTSTIPDHSHTVDTPSHTGGTGASDAANTGAQPDTITDEQNIDTTGQASLPESATSGISGVGANDPEYYTLAYIMRMS